MIGDEAARLRREYESHGIDAGDLADDPISEFEKWFAEASVSGLEEPNAFVLATVDEDGTPSARAVLMKDLSDSGLVFYTGLDSRKSKALRAHALAAATFVWIPLHRQVRFEGPVRAVSAAEADAYFATRPRGAQIAAHASRQSEIVSDRSELERQFEHFSEEFPDEVPRPAGWGGWRLAPMSVEFWQGRPNRFHDRIRFELIDGAWAKERLAP